MAKIEKLLSNKIFKELKQLYIGNRCDNKAITVITVNDEGEKEIPIWVGSMDMMLEFYEIIYVESTQQMIENLVATNEIVRCNKEVIYKKLYGNLRNIIIPIIRIEDNCLHSLHNIVDELEEKYPVLRNFVCCREFIRDIKNNSKRPTYYDGLYQEDSQNRIKCGCEPDTIDIMRKALNCYLCTIKPDNVEFDYKIHSSNAVIEAWSKIMDYTKSHVLDHNICRGYLNRNFTKEISKVYINKLQGIMEHRKSSIFIAYLIEIVALLIAHRTFLNDFSNIEKFGQCCFIAIANIIAIIYNDMKIEVLSEIKKHAANKNDVEKLVDKVIIEFGEMQLDDIINCINSFSDS